MCNDEINTRSRTLMKNFSNVIFNAENKTPANTKIILKKVPCNKTQKSLPMETFQYLY